MAGINAGIGTVWLFSALVGVGTIRLSPITLAQTAPSNIVPDATLGAESSQVIQNFNGLPVEAIAGGAQRGQNLFHSFSQFNVSAGRGAYFAIQNNAVRNVLTRVTGTNISDIQGTLGTFRPIDGTVRVPGVNLFLINPNGIVFGQNASLDVGGSFFATTANAVQLGDASLFSASQPASNNLLNVNPSAFLFNAIAAQGEIINRSSATQTILGNSTFGLQVPNGATLTLLGGSVTLDDSSTVAFGGRIELGGLAVSGIVGLDMNDNNLPLRFPEDKARGDVMLRNGAIAAVSTTTSGGNLVVTAHNVDVLGGSQIVAGILQGQASDNRQAGNITIHATERVNVSGQSSNVANRVVLNSTGNGGNISINTGSLFVTNGASLGTITLGQGDAGNLSITVRDNTSFDGVSTVVQSIVANTAVGRGGNLTLSTGILNVTNGAQLDTITVGQGDAGNLSIATGSLIVTNGSLVFTNTEGRGNAGNLSIAARDTINLDGVGSDGKSSKVGSQVAQTAVGRGGNITIASGSLAITNGAQLGTITSGQGDAGNLSITARDNIRIDGVGSSGQISGVGSQINQIGIGRGGSVTIDTGSLEVTNGAQLATFTSGQGDAGNLSIAARDSIRIDGESSAIGSQTNQIGIGRGGNVTIDTGSLEVTNGAQLSANTFGQGNAGNLSITTDSLSVASGARLNTIAYGQGNAGSIFITAHDTIRFDGVGSNGLSSGAFSAFGGATVGRGGDLTIVTGSLSVTNGAQVNSSTFGRGNAGNLSITARNTIIFDGVGINGASSGAGNQVAETAVGQGGKLTITTGSLFITNGAILVANSYGQGDAGAILLRVQDQLRMVNGIIGTDSLQNSGGAIYITARSIRLLGSSSIQTAVTKGAGSGGDITLEAGSIIALEDSNILAYAQQGKGGNITLSTRAFFGQNYRPGSPPPFYGNNRVDINASGTISGIITLPDVSFLQNSLTEFPQTFTDTTQLLANSCIVRSSKQNGSFFVTGSGGLPVRPGDAPPASFPTGEVRSLPITQSQNNRPWQPGDPIVEPQGIYRLPNGKLVMSRECQTQ